MSGVRSIGRRAWVAWRGYPADYRQFCGVVFVAGVAYGFVDILVPLYGEALGVSNLAIGALFAAFSLPKSVVSPLVGALSDRVGHRRTVVAAGFVLAGLLYAAIPLFGAIVAFLALRVLLGGVDAGIRPTAQTLVSEVGGEEGRGRSLGLYSSFRTFGTVVGPVAAGALVAAAGFPLAFGTTGALFIAAGVLTYLLIGPEFGPESAGLSWREAAASVRSSLRVPDPARVAVPTALAVVYGVAFFRFVGLHAYVRFLPLYLGDVGFGEGAVGALFSVRILSAAVVFPFGGSASDRFGRLPVLATGVFLSGVAPVALFVAPALPASTAVVVAALLVAGVGRALFIPTLPALVSDLSPETSRGAQIGGVSAVGSLAVGVAPLAAGAIADAVGRRGILLFAAASLAAGLALFVPLAVARVRE
jgi:MFS family permease